MSPDRSLNPYQPPNSVYPARNRGSRFFELLCRFPGTTSARLLRGEFIIVDGIAFYLNPSDLSTAFAGSPSSTNTTERMNLIVAETIRTLPILFADHPSLAPIFRGRKLVVQMFTNYASLPHEVIREQPLEWDILNGILERDSD